jgi:hypothetical protein
MKELFIFFWLFTLLCCWIIATTTIVNGENNSASFKIKTFFFWLAVASSVFGSYYLFN